MREEKEKKNKKSYSIILALLVVLGISIGYAIISTTLKINSNVTVPKTVWDIHFENLIVTSGSVVATTPATINTAKTDINYAVNLNKPGDFYEL